MDPKKNYEMLKKSFKDDIRILLNLMKELIEKWYMNIILKNSYLAKNRHKRQEFMENLINQTVFSNNNNLYYTLFNLFALINNELEKKLDHVMEVLKEIRPENMDISPAFSMKNSKEPFANVINLMNEQSGVISGYDKFVSICRIKEEIRESIDRYWEEWDPNIPETELLIDSDQLLTIVTFCIVKTRNCSLVSSLMFIREFANKNMMENSYYFTTYDAAMSYLLNLKEEEINGILNREF